MRTSLKVLTATAALLLLVGCGKSEQKKAEEAAQDATAKINEIKKMEQNELKPLGYSNPSESTMSNTEFSILLEYKKYLEKYTKLCKETIHILDYDKVETRGVSKEQLRASLATLQKGRQDQLDTINDYLKRKGVFDQKGNVKPEFKAPKTSQGTQPSGHKH